MKRKVIQIADSTQLVSLPRKWALQHGVKKGDEIDVREEGSKLVVALGEESTKSKDIEVNVDGLDKDSLIFLLRGLYIRGYNQIKFTFNNPYIMYYRFNKKVTISSVIHKEVGICQGLDIIQEKGNTFVIKNISVPSIKEFDTILRRIFLLLIDMTSDLHLAGKKRDFVLLESFQDKHDTITRLINYNLKTLNTIGYSDHKNNELLFSIIFSLDLAVDTLKNAARDMIEAKIKLGTKAVNILHEIRESIKLYYDLFYNFSFEKTNQFVSSRQNIINTIKRQVNELGKQDIRIVVMVENILEVLRDLYSLRVSMQY